MSFNSIFLYDFIVNLLWYVVMLSNNDCLVPFIGFCVNDSNDRVVLISYIKSLFINMFYHI